MLILVVALAGCGATGGGAKRGGGGSGVRSAHAEPPPARFQTSTYAEVNYDWRAFGWDFAPFGGPLALPIRLGETAKADHEVADAGARAVRYRQLVAQGYTPIYQVEARSFQAAEARDIVLRGVAERGMGVVLLFVEPARIEGEQATAREPRNPVLHDAFDRLAKQARLKRKSDGTANAPAKVGAAGRGFRAEGTVWTKLSEPLQTLRVFTDALWTIDQETLFRLGGKVGRNNVQIAVDKLRSWATRYPGMKDRATAAADRLTAQYLG